ncbi:hypothetical protein ADL35_45750, partial [Streptomyces sp. NRRL WC-3753]
MQAAPVTPLRTSTTRPAAWPSVTGALRAVESVPASYAPECLSACELAFHCRERARAAGDVT